MFKERSALMRLLSRTNHFILLTANLQNQLPLTDLIRSADFHHLHYCVTETVNVKVSLCSPVKVACFTLSAVVAKVRVLLPLAVPAATVRTVSPLAIAVPPAETV